MARCGALVLVLLVRASTALASCDVAGNVLTNCGFSFDLPPWDDTAGTCGHSTIGLVQPGSADCNSAFNGIQHSLALFQCTNAAVTGTYSFGASILREAGTAASCTLTVTPHSVENCGAQNGDPDSSPIAPGAGAWGHAPINSFDLPGNTTSMAFLITCGASMAAGAFSVLIDHTFAGQGLGLFLIFADAFESGNDLMWTASVP